MTPVSAIPPRLQSAPLAKASSASSSTFPASGLFDTPPAASADPWTNAMRVNTSKPGVIINAGGTPSHSPGM